VSSPRFEVAVDFTLKWEGGLCRDVGDPGGLTNFGVDTKDYAVDLAKVPENYRNNFPSTVDKLTKAQACILYYYAYWGPVMADQLPLGVGEVVFDSAVNVGIYRAVKWLQRVVAVAEDGVVGGKTISAAYRAAADPKSVANGIIDRRESYYRFLANNSSEFGRFLKGWINRSEDLRKFIKTL
jgi:lysozyme family protein